MDDYLPTVTTNPSVFSGSAVAPPYSGVDTSSYINQGSSGSSDSSSLGNWLGGLGSMLTSVVNNFAEDMRARRQRKWNEKMMDKQNEWNLEMWNKANEYNSAGAQVQRMKDAGLNPMNYQPGQFAAESLQSADTKGYTRGTSSIANPIEAQGNFDAQKKSLELMDAQIAKTKSETDSTTLDNEFAKKTMDARVKGEELANSLTESQIKKIMDERNKIIAEINKLVAETDNEIEKKLLISAQTKLASAQADEIVALLPYKEALMTAQTQNQKAQASAAFYNAMYNKKLINAGVIDKIIAEYDAKIENYTEQAKAHKSAAEASRAQAEAARARAAMDSWKTSVLTGHAFDYVINDLNANELERELAGFFNGVFNVAGMVTSTVGNIIKF